MLKHRQYFNIIFYSKKVLLETQKDKENSLVRFFVCLQDILRCKEEVNKTLEVELLDLRGKVDMLEASHHHR